MAQEPLAGRQDRDGRLATRIPAFPLDALVFGSLTGLLLWLAHRSDVVTAGLWTTAATGAAIGLFGGPREHSVVMDLVGLRIWRYRRHHVLWSSVRLVRLGPRSSWRLLGKLRRDLIIERTDGTSIAVPLGVRWATPDQDEDVIRQWVMEMNRRRDRRSNDASAVPDELRRLTRASGRESV